MKYICAFLVLLVFSGCDPNCQKLLIINSSEKEIFYFLSTDTVVYRNTYLYKLSSKDSVKPNFVKGFCREDTWKKKIERYSKDSTLHIFFLTLPMLDDNIISKHLYNRIDLKTSKLDSTNWVVRYN
jgi:hypothetical protein